MPVRLAPSVRIICCDCLLDSFLKSREVIALLLKSYNSLYNSHISTESGLVDIPSESDLLVRVANQD
jgi:hypothetical protein